MQDAWRGALLAVCLLAGCLAPAADIEPATAPTSVPEAVRVLGVSAREPAIAQLPDGTLLVAAYGGADQVERGTRPILFRSGDGGATWTRVEQGTVIDGAIGNSDADLAVAPDGTAYHATMTWLPWGHAISVGASVDGGTTWTWETVAAMPGVDRPWVEVAPDGVAHLTWSSPRGLHHATSSDRGASWTEGPLVHPTGGSGVLAIGPSGELAVRVFPLRAPATLGVAFVFLMQDPAADGVAVSRDGGATWTYRELPGDRTYPGLLATGGDGTPRWSDPVAFDASGTLYATWGEDDQLMLASSGDLGDTWELHPLSRQEGRLAFYPFLRGGATGELAATWFTYGDDDLLAHVAHVSAADTASPRVALRTIDPASDTDTSGEYFQSTFIADGSIVAALPIATGVPATSGFEFIYGPIDGLQ